MAALVGLMTLFNLRGISLVANLNSIIVVVQVAIMAVFLGLVIHGVYLGEGAGTLTSTRPFWSENAHVVPMITGATILCFSFLGFDGISSLSEETQDAGRVIPKAIFLTALIGGVIFVAVAYFLQLYFRISHALKSRMRLSRKSCCMLQVNSSSPLFWCSPASPYWHPVWRHMQACLA